MVCFCLVPKTPAEPVSRCVCAALRPPKNADKLMPEAVELLANSTKPLPCALFAAPSAAAEAGDGAAASAPRFNGGAKPRPDRRSRSTPALGALVPASGGRRGSSIVTESVGAQFRGQLAKLISDIGSTAPHFVRCFKPNDANAPGVVDRQASAPFILSHACCIALTPCPNGVSLYNCARTGGVNTCMCGVCVSCVAAARRAAPLRRRARGRASRARRLPGAFRSPHPPSCAALETPRHAPPLSQDAAPRPLSRHDPSLARRAPRFLSLSALAAGALPP